MQKKNRSLAAILAVVLVAVIAIGGTLAYLTDSQGVINTFNKSTLDITIDEPNYEEPPQIFPGDVFPKDPTVEGVVGDSYMRMIVEFKDKDDNLITDEELIALIWETIYYDAEDAVTEKQSSDELLALLADETLTKFNTVDFAEASSTAGKYIYNYISDLEGSEDMFLEGTFATLFNKIIVPTNWNQIEMDKLGTYKIVVTVQAIQVENFDSAEEAFAALDAEEDDETMLVDYVATTLVADDETEPEVSEPVIP